MSEIKFDELKTDLKRLKLLLIILTLSELSYIFLPFLDVKLSVGLDYEYHINWMILAFHFLVVGFFIWFIFKKIPTKSKSNSIFMILFLGIIGMWLWIPNKKEIDDFII